MRATSWYRRPGIYWTLLVLWAVLLWWLSSQPGTGQMPRFPHSDKVLHTTYFFCGGLVFQLALLCSGFKTGLKGLILAGILFVALIGALDEHHQTFTPGRSGHDVYDWLADCLGGLLAALVMGRFYKRSSLFSSKS